VGWQCKIDLAGYLVRKNDYGRLEIEKLSKQGYDG
jgi:hypothetical protein